jgi:stalled ribosome alternative rescue factor ArfA
MNIRKDETKQFVAEKLDRSRTEKAKKVPALHLEES